MNYLAHIHLSELTQTSKLGNFLGDFVKGDLSHWSADGRNEAIDDTVKQGITLHRKIDAFTDSHLSVQKLRELFPDSLRRISGIILDIYFDHLLCNDLLSRDANLTNLMLQQFYKELSESDLFISNRFQTVKNGLLAHKWLINYQYEVGYVNALRQIESRLNGKVQFATKGHEFLKTQEEHIQQSFFEFYPQLIKYTEHLSSSFNDD